MKLKNATAIFILLPSIIFSQQQFVEISVCGGADTISINISDNDSDGVDDFLEQKLLEKFMPVFIRFNDDDCPGPSPTGSTVSDTNIVICRIYPVPPQYTSANDLQLLSQNPQPLAEEKKLKTGLFWFPPTLIAHCALLYGKDCGLTAHTADVEGFTFTLQYTGNLTGGWRFDTILNNWKGVVIQTVSHAGTLCEKIETLPRLSVDFINGYDTIFASPDKHGNYLTISKCNSGFLCDPSCNGTKIPKKTKAVNAGEENAPLVTDLGNFYFEYAGENPWGDSKFLESFGGNAGTIKGKLLKELTDDFIKTEELDSCYKICNLYETCFNCGNISNCIFSCDTVLPDSNGAVSPQYECSVLVQDMNAFSEIKIFPNPSSEILMITGLRENKSHEILLNDLTGKIIFKTHSTNTFIELNIRNFKQGIYFLQIKNENEIRFKKIVILK